MGRHSAWNEADHPRADDGKFGHGAGGHSPGDTGRGMPDVIAGADIPVRGGDEIALDFHADGSATLATSTTSVHLPDSSVSDLKYSLQHIGSEDTQVGDEVWVKTVERDSDGRPTGSSSAALIRKEGEGSYSLRLAQTGNPSAEELRNAPEVRLNDKDLTKIDGAFLRGKTATRIDTGNGPADLYITDDNRFGIRAKGDDGKPAEARLVPRSFAKINHAISVVLEGFDENDPTGPDSGVTRVNVPTNIGPVRVQLFGDWNGNNPGDRLEIAPVNGGWKLSVNGPQQDDFLNAWSKVADAGEGLQIYDPSMGWKK